MHNNSFFKPFLFLVSIIFFVSCDKEYSTVGDALIGDNNFELVKYHSNVVAHNEKVTPIQSNNLPVNALGIYDNPAFGKTTANFATQLTLTAVDPVIGANPVIDSVYVDVPYFSTLLSTDANGNHVYALDSIYGGASAKIKLSVYESGRYMGAQNGNAQIFYTDQNTEFNNLKIGNRLNDDESKDQNDEFFFDPKEHKFSVTDATTSKVTTTRTVPSMRLKLNKAYFDSKIIHAPAGSLTTNDVFINYFKGLYFKVEQSGSDKGSLAMINFAKGTVTIKYKEDLSTTVGAVTTVTRADKSIVLNMSGSTASLLDQSNTNTDYETATSNPNRVLGDEKLYLKGGEGSLAVIDLFDKKDLIGYDSNGNLTGPNGVSDELDDIRKNGWLINEANLVFNVDQTAMASSYEPDRIYLFDFTNNRPIVDYFLDGTSAVRPKRARVVFDGNINRDPNSTTTPKRGLTYKIRITNHIRNLVKYADSTNVKLGVVVTESIDIANSFKLKTPSSFISQAPKASVMNPLGTILYGSTAAVADDKRLKLEIYYTKPK
jgi:hypothetical protein